MKVIKKVSLVSAITTTYTETFAAGITTGISIDEATGLGTMNRNSDDTGCTSSFNMALSQVDIYA